MRILTWKKSIIASLVIVVTGIFAIPYKSEIAPGLSVMVADADTRVGIPDVIILQYYCDYLVNEFELLDSSVTNKQGIAIFEKKQSHASLGSRLCKAISRIWHGGTHCVLGKISYITSRDYRLPPLMILCDSVRMSQLGGADSQGGVVIKVHPNTATHMQLRKSAPQSGSPQP